MRRIIDESYLTELRERMVREQITPEVGDVRVLEAMLRVPRHRFVSEAHRAQAYENRPLPIGIGQTISQPLMVAVMAQALHLEGHERVLEVGTGSGYNAAVLAELSREVITIERHSGLAEQARAVLAELGYANVTVVVGDGTRGYAACGPYPRILVTAAAPHVPRALIEQLDVNGRLVMPVGHSGVQTLTVLTKDIDGRTYTHEQGGCAFVPLIAGAEPNDEQRGKGRADL